LARLCAGPAFWVGLRPRVRLYSSFNPAPLPTKDLILVVVHRVEPRRAPVDLSSTAARLTPERLARCRRYVGRLSSPRLVDHRGNLRSLVVRIHIRGQLARSPHAGIGLIPRPCTPAERVAGVRIMTRRIVSVRKHRRLRARGFLIGRPPVRRLLATGLVLRTPIRRRLLLRRLAISQRPIGGLLGRCLPVA
jgi:hypothetical protein